MLLPKRCRLILATVAYVLACVQHANADLSEKIRAASKGGVVELDNESYDIYTATPRPYGIVVLLTAMSPEHACIPCREIDPEFRLVASNWRNQNVKDNTLFFGSVEFKRGVEVYRKLGLTSAPTLLYFPPSESKKDVTPVKYDMNRYGLSAEAVAQWLSGLIGQKINIVHPIDYTKYAVAAVGILVVAVLGKFMVTKYSYIIKSSRIWIGFCLGVILMMCSGHMWNHIRHAPYIGHGRHGGLDWIAPGFQSQYVMESQVFASLQAIAAISVVVLAVKVPEQTDPNRQSLISYIAISTLIADFSIMLWLFRIKNGGYPFKLLF